jgi:hypothetical protein
MDQPPRASSYDYEAPQGDPWDASNEPDAHSPLMMIQPDAEDVSAEDNADLDGWIDATALDEPEMATRDASHIAPLRDREVDGSKIAPMESGSFDGSKISPRAMASFDGSKLAPMREGDFDGSKIPPRAEASFDGRGIDPLFDADMEFTQDEADSAMRESFGGVESLANQLIAEAHAKRQRSGMRR